MRYAGLFLVTVLAAACAAAPPSEKSLADRNLLTFEQIQQSHSQSAYEMIQQLRPRWLSQRGLNSPVVLYVNESRVGTVSRLREYAPRDLREVRYLDATQATQRFGTGHRSGAIMLYLRGW